MTTTHHEGASHRGAPSLSGDAHWQCRVCKTWKVVPPLARDCERRDAADLGVDLEELLATISRTP